MSVITARIGDSRATALLSSILLNALLPLVVAYFIISFLVDPSNIDTSELQTNSFLMSTHSIFRNIFDPDILAVSVGASAILLLASMAGLHRAPLFTATAEEKADIDVGGRLRI